MPILRTPTPTDLSSIKALALATAMFTVDEVDFFDDLLSGYFAQSLEGHRWIVAESNGTVLGAAHYAPEPFGDRVWNLYFIAVDPPRHGEGLGTALVNFVERDLLACGDDVARILVIETSSTAKYDDTRAFYSKLGYCEEARIREFYGPSDDKVVFWKSLFEPA